MQIKIVQDTAARFLKENASTVLTAGGVVGTVVTGVFSFRAGMKYKQVEIDDLKEIITEEAPHVSNIQSPSTKDQVKASLPHFVPPVAIGGATIASIIGANVVSAKRAAVLAAAYGISQRQLEEYRAKLEEKLGVQKYQKAKAEMAQERVDKTPGGNTVVIFGDEVLCFDENTGRYFKSTMEKIRRAENSTNQEIIRHGFAEASHFYSELELPGTVWSDNVGWTQPFELEISTIIHDEKPCVSLDFKTMPEADYVRGAGDRYR